MSNNISTIFYAKSLEETKELLATDFDRGLSSGEVSLRQKKFRPNTLPRAKSDGPLKLFLRQFHNPLIYVLLISAVIAFFMKKWTDGGVVLGVVFLNSIIGFIQEYRASKALDALSAMVPEMATVIRGAKKMDIMGVNLVPGDIVFLQSGDKVPADIRLIKTKNLKIDEAALTGESVPVDKKLGEVAEETLIGDRFNMAYAGTLVTYGTAQGVVVGIGENTEIGKISSLLGSVNSLETPLTKALGKVGDILTYGILAISAILMLVGWWRGHSVTDALLAAITLAVAAIPEGLPAIVTITLAVGVKRMAKRKAVIRRLPAVETLGSTSVICSDKTGTLTKNEMTVLALGTVKDTYRLTGAGYDCQGELIKDGVRQRANSDVIELLKAGVLCSDAVLRKDEKGYSVIGDPTEGALIVAFDKVAGFSEKLREEHRRLDTFPFESENQFMATLIDDEFVENTIYLKGSPEKILEKCLVSQEEKKEIEQRVLRKASEGMRVLAFAKKATLEKEITEHLLCDGYTFLGLQGMIDPAREEVVDSIRECHAAGITVKMITGDHRDTAHAIAKNLGIDNGDPPVSGEELARLSDEEFSRKALSSNIFARVAPEHKLKLVKAIQDHGHVVAMTGDGVNDAPALKQADIGVAMGITGTSVSKESAELVLTNDNFSTIAAAVEEGRRVYDNIIKSLAFILPTNLGEALIILIAVLFFPIVNDEALMPILPVQILWINLVATVALALPLAFEAKESDIMKRRPRNVNEPIFTSFVMYRTIVVAILMAVGAIALFLFEYKKLLSIGHEQPLALKEAQTMAVTTVVFFQIFYLFNCRSLKDSIFEIGFFSNKSIFLGVIGLIMAQAAFVHVPLLNTLFSSAPLSLESWGRAIAVGFVIVPVVMIEKRLFRSQSISQVSDKTIKL